MHTAIEHSARAPSTPRQPQYRQDYLRRSESDTARSKSYTTRCIPTYILYRESSLAQDAAGMREQNLI